MDTEKLRFNSSNILVVGDFILDQYIGGDVERISPEAPVPVLRTTWKRYQLGGAGNVINNIQSLSSNSRAVTCIGSGKTGTKLMELLKESGTDTRFIMRSSDVSTTKKIRIVARNQQVIRVDDEIQDGIPESFCDYLEENIGGIFDGIDAVIISDYGKGVVTEKVAQLIINKSNELNIPTLIDPKGSDWTKYRGAYICTPNLNELSIVHGSRIDPNDEDMIHRAAEGIRSKYQLKNLLVTRSEKGMSLITETGEKKDFAVCKMKEVIDVSGAGDTVISVFALSTVIGFSKEMCCKVANRAASIVISKFGTATLTIDELKGSIIFESRKKIIDRADAKNLSDYLHDQSKRIVFTNGCFDLLHSGHVSSLEQAHIYGDTLIVGLNSDDSVRRLKGPKRPIVDQDNRAYMLQALSIVDYVIIFDDDTPEELIKDIRPDVIVKGEDYLNKKVVGSDFIATYGGSVQLIKLKPGLSTTKIVDRILNSKE